MFWVAGRLQQHQWHGFMLSMLSIHCGYRLESVEKMEAGEKQTTAKDNKFLDLA
jgi:hypothetical protein